MAREAFVDEVLETTYQTAKLARLMSSKGSPGGHAAQHSCSQAWNMFVSEPAMERS